MDKSPASMNDCHQRNEPAAVHVEVLQSSSSSAMKKDIEVRVRKVLEQKAALYNNSVFRSCNFGDQMLKSHVEKVAILVSGLPSNERITVTKEFINSCRIHVYRAITDEPSMEGLNNDEENTDTVAAFRHWALPNAEFEGLWENLVFDSDIKEQMLSYAETMLYFADRKVDANIVTCNRMLLFHGPPGTGKTTLCKAISQKLCIRLGQRYRRGRFLEINSHSLFSKWFSESGKLVTKLFAKIHEQLEDQTSLLIIMIDEVESLTVARKQALSGNEPSDAVRVVNALLTQIDSIRRWPNVLILTTSNLSEAVDPAFLDRADIKQFIGVPSSAAIYLILYEAIMELRRTGIICSSTDSLLPTFSDSDSDEGRRRMEVKGDSYALSKKLFLICRKCQGFSGRTIRKLPMLAYAFKLSMRKTISLEDFIDALAYATAKQVENAHRNSDDDGPVPNAINGSFTLSPTRNSTIA